MSVEHFHLVLDNGELVYIKCPSKDIEEFYDEIEIAIKKRDWWYPSRCELRYMGYSLDRINTSRIVGML